MPIREFRAPAFIKTALIVTPFACALGFFMDWENDNALLHRQVVETTRDLNTDSARIRAINDWVYGHGGFGKNNDYFLVPALGPTPIQVLRDGGDCSDKSRLVAAMLNEININAGLVMISPCPDCPFIHTVVEAEYERGRMVVDPTWHVDYPAGEGKFLGVRDLAGTSLGRERVGDLQRQRGASDKIADMPATEATFDYAVTVNWSKNSVTRATATMLHRLGYAPGQMFRPRFLEDPKLALTIFFALLGLMFISLKVLMYFGRNVVRAIADRHITDPRNTVKDAGPQEAEPATRSLGPVGARR
jgi:hypothetical protein